MNEPDNAGQPRRLALLLEYDGAAYAGSQLQPNASTVQSVLEEAIESVTGETVRASFAGRTDAGVHARGQVASFVTATRLSTVVLQRALNARLPDDVVVLALADTSEDFDPRRQALWRHYRYVIENRAVRPALDREKAWYVYQPLDEAAMSAAAQSLIGRHDFAPFASRLASAQASTVRELMRFDVHRQGTRVICDVTGNAFLPHQVRRMTGALVEVGKGKLSIEGFGALLQGATASAGPAAPPHGLYLMGVEYGRALFPGPEVQCDDSAGT